MAGSTWPPFTVTGGVLFEDICPAKLILDSHEVNWDTQRNPAKPAEDIYRFTETLSCHCYTAMHSTFNSDYLAFVTMRRVQDIKTYVGTDATSTNVVTWAGFWNIERVVAASSDGGGCTVSVVFKQTEDTWYDKDGAVVTV